MPGSCANHLTYRDHCGACRRARGHSPAASSGDDYDVTASIELSMSTFDSSYDSGPSSTSCDTSSVSYDTGSSCSDSGSW